MVAPSSRRGFLRGLTTLPLIGGGVALLGAPTAVAEPISESLLDSYDAWLEYERRSLQWERNRNAEMVHRLSLPFVMQMRRAGQPISAPIPCDYIPAANGGASWHHMGEVLPPSTRAALVLATVGCSWREGLL